MSQEEGIDILHLDGKVYLPIDGICRCGASEDQETTFCPLEIRGDKPYCTAKCFCADTDRPDGRNVVWEMVRHAV